MVSVTISPRGTSRENEFSRVDEFLFHVFLGKAGVTVPTGTSADTEVRWPYLRRTSMNSTRDKGRPKQFYPIYIDPSGESGPFVARIGEPISREVDRQSIQDEPGLVTVWPVNPDGIEMTWGMVPQTLRRTIDGGFARVSEGHAANAPYVIAYVTTDAQDRVATGEYLVTGIRSDGSKIVTIPGGRASKPTTVWRETSHDAGAHGTGLLRSLIPGRRFPFPKSLYAVEDTLRLVVKDKPNAVVLDFFAGSGTTAHAVARLNRQDGGRRQSIMVTNNEVSVDEAAGLRGRGLRPGDPEWEALGIFEHITRPRVTAAIMGKTPDGEPIVGDYKFTDESPMADGFEENVAFLELRYLDADDIDLGHAFDDIAPLLWLRAGGRGPIARRVDDAGTPLPFAWTDRYGVLFDEDHWRSFVSARPETARTAFIVTYSPTVFAGIAAELPTSMDTIRLYDTYLSLFQPERGRT
jgi:adenine-specific DNA-methyltransferase